MKERMTRMMGVAGLMMLLTFIPEFAWALSFFDPVPGDISVSLLMKQIFGDAMPNGLGSGGADPLVGMFSVMNAGILSVGGVLAAYNLVVGTMQTAHHGEMLGKQWSSMWLPIRTGLGTALVVPFGKGYCVAQVLVMWLAVQGVGLADKMWEKFVDTGFDGMVSQMTYGGPSVKAFTNAAVGIQLCMKAIEREKADNPQLVGDQYETKTVPYTKTTLSGRTEEGIRYGTLANPTQCGTVSREFGKSSLDRATQGAQQSYASSSGFFSGFASAVGAFANGLTSSVKPEDMDPVNRAHKEGAKFIMTAATNVAAYAIQTARLDINGAEGADAQNKTQEAELIKALVDAEGNYSLNVASAASINPSIFDLESLKSKAKEGGWMMAGGWFMKVARGMEAVNKEVNRTFEIEPGSAVGDISADLQKTGITIVERMMTTNGEGEQKSPGVGGSIGNGLAQMFSGLDVTELKNNTSHPIIIADQVGNRLVNAGLLGIGAIAAVIGLSTFLGMAAKFSPLKFMAKELMNGADKASAFFDGFGTALAGTITGMLILIIMLGMYLKVYIPIMPFVFYFTASLAWMLIVVQAMIAAPIWAVMHLTGSGDDIMGGSRTGYTMLLSLMLRPALLVAGFAAAMVVAYPFGMILNRIYFDVILVSSDPGGGFFYNMLMTLMSTLIYCVLLTGLLHQCFQLIHIIPNEVLQWFGGQGSRLGDSAEQMSGKVTNAVKTAEGAVAALGMSGSQFGARAGQNVKQDISTGGKGLEQGNAVMAMQQKASAASSTAASSQSPSELKTAAATLEKEAEGMQGVMNEMGGDKDLGVSADTARKFNLGAESYGLPKGTRMFNKGADGMHHRTPEGQKVYEGLQASKGLAVSAQSLALQRADQLSPKSTGTSAATPESIKPPEEGDAV